MPIVHRPPSPGIWNATAVYRRTGAAWKSVHVHWSFIKPELKPRPSEEAR